MCTHCLQEHHQECRGGQNILIIIIIGVIIIKFGATASLEEATVHNDIRAHMFTRISQLAEQEADVHRAREA
jgi:hypothetical protein